MNSATLADTPEANSTPSTLGVRLRDTLARSRMSPRNLGGAIQVHYATIYLIMGGQTQSVTPLIQHALVTAVSTMDKLVEAGRLPLKVKLPRKDKTDTLKAMLAEKH